jgi:RNA polymerase sigma-70 factor (ECF subfamily)
MTIPTDTTSPTQQDRDFVMELAAAREGDTAALGRLLLAARVYLVNVADAELEPILRAKGSGSDVVQEALTEAQQILARFTGSRFAEFLAWLRAILLNKLSDFRRHYFRTHTRQVSRERPIEADTSSGCGIQRSGDGTTPSAEATRQEEERLLAAALGRLAEQYRQVIAWRNFEGLPFAEIGRRLGKSEDAARMLWGRAIDQLRQELERPG